MTDQLPTREAELHFRRIGMHAWRCSDGLFELEGGITDRKLHDFEPRSGGKCAPAGEPVHDIGARLVCDMDLRIHAVKTFTEAAPYGECPDGGQALQSLKGLRTTSGWSRGCAAGWAVRAAAPI